MRSSSSRTGRLVAPRLVLAILLIGAELWICRLALSPSVDEEYRAHFMTDPPSCWLPANLRRTIDAEPLPRSVTIGALKWPLRCSILRAGWEQEGWGAWTTGPVALLRLPVAAETRLVRLTVFAPSYAREGQVVMLIQPGDLMPERVVVPPSGQIEIAVTVSLIARKAGHLDLHLAMDRPRSPASFGLSYDTRRLGIGLIRVSW